MCISRDFDEKYGISLSRCHARIGYILCTHRSWWSTPGQLLKKVAQAKPKGLLTFLCFPSANFSTDFFICSKIPVDLHFFALHRKSPTVFSIVLVQLSNQTRTSSIYFDYKCRFGAIAYARISQNSHKVSILSIGRPSARSFSCTSST